MGNLEHGQDPNMAWFQKRGRCLGSQLVVVKDGIERETRVEEEKEMKRRDEERKRWEKEKKKREIEEKET